MTEKEPVQLSFDFTEGTDDGHMRVTGAYASLDGAALSTANLEVVRDPAAQLLGTYGQLAQLEGHIRWATKLVHERHAKWWQNPATGEPIQRNVGELLMLAVSELAEGMEGHRKGLKDDHLPAYPMLTVELADCLIRILDMAGGLKLDLAGALRDKLEYNAKRADHTHEARLAPGGKKY